MIAQVRVLLTRILEEKERKLKEGMKMMGLSAVAYWLSWLITAGVKVGCMVFMVSIIAKVRSRCIGAFCAGWRAYGASWALCGHQAGAMVAIGTVRQPHPYAWLRSMHGHSYFLACVHPHSLMLCFACAYLLPPVSQFGKLFEHSDFFIVFIFFALFGITCLGYTFIMSTFFSKARTGGAVGMMLFFVLSLPTLAFKVRYVLAPASSSRAHIQTHMMKVWGAGR